MATIQEATQPGGSGEQVAEKGLKSGALGLISSTVIATASVAPAYSLAATLGLIVVAVGLSRTSAEWLAERIKKLVE